MDEGTSTAADPSGQAQLLWASIDTFKLQSLNRRVGRGDQGGAKQTVAV